MQLILGRLCNTTFKSISGNIDVKLVADWCMMKPVDWQTDQRADRNDYSFTEMRD